MKQMGNRLHELRKKHGYTLDEVAEKVDIPKSTLSRLENAQLKTVNRGYVDRLAKLYEVDPAYILGYEDTPTVNLTYSAPGKETIQMLVEGKPIMGETGLRVALYQAALSVPPENMKVAIELLRSLAKGGDDNA